MVVTQVVIVVVIAVVRSVVEEESGVVRVGLCLCGDDGDDDVWW